MHEHIFHIRTLFVTLKVQTLSPFTACDVLVESKNTAYIA